MLDSFFRTMAETCFWTDLVDYVRRLLLCITSGLLLHVDCCLVTLLVVYRRILAATSSCTMSRTP